MKLTCPHCHKPFTYRPNKSAFESSHRFDTVAGAMNDLPGLNTRRETTTFMPTIEANVIVPRAQAVTSAIFAGPFTGAIVGTACYVAGLEGWDLAMSFFLPGAAAFFAVAWWRWEQNAGWSNSLLTQLEELTGLDIDQDGEVGEPDSLKLEISEGKRQHLEEWPVKRAELVRFARAVTSDSPNDTFSERTAKECGISREQFTFIRDRFFEKHWATWKNQKNPKSGILLRASGWAVLAAIAAGQLPIGVQPGDDTNDDLGMSPHYVTRGGTGGSWG